MRRGTIVDLKKYNRLFGFFAQNSWLIALLVLFVGGFTLGVFSGIRLEFAAVNTSAYIKNFIAVRTEYGVFKTVLYSFFHSLFFPSLCFVAGASIFGVALTPICVGLNGWFCGCAAAYLYSEFSFKGVAFHSVLILPTAVILTLALLLAARESVRFSLTLARLTFPSASPSNMSADFKRYCGRYFMLCFLVLLSAVADALLSHSFLNSFSLF